MLPRKRLHFLIMGTTLLVLSGCFGVTSIRSSSDPSANLNQGPGENGAGYSGFTAGAYYERSSLTSGKCQLSNGVFYDEEIDVDTGGNFFQKTDCNSDEQMEVEPSLLFQSNAESTRFAYLGGNQSAATSSGIFEAASIVNGAALTEAWCIPFPQSVAAQYGIPSSPNDRYTFAVTAGAPGPVGTAPHNDQVSWTSTLGFSDPLQSILPTSFTANSDYIPTVGVITADGPLGPPYTNFQFTLNFTKSSLFNQMGHWAVWIINIYDGSTTPALHYMDNSLCMAIPNYVPLIDP